MILREATPADRDQVVALALRFHGATPYAQLLVIERTRVEALFAVALATGVVLVAEAEHTAEGGELVAFLALAALEHTLSGERYAEEIAWWVEPRYRDGTIGPRLLALAEAWARADGCAFIKMVAPVGTAVGTFYDRRGYHPIETAWMKRVA